MQRAIHSLTSILCLSVFASLAHAAPSSEAQALHVINRIGFGPAPGQLEKVMKMGVEAYIAEQLNPEKIPLPQALQDDLAALETLHLSQRRLLADYQNAQRQIKIDQAAGGNGDRSRIRQMVYEPAYARLRLAIDSPRQLEEVMVDFWFNHFNVFIDKGDDRAYTGAYEREAIRPHVLGRFRDLLGATARHPAMLYYLDNWQSTRTDYQPVRRRAGVGKANGLNENYARELMELHTLGVDGGYSQKDVTELARMLTGWTLDQRATFAGDLFDFDSEMHDPGSKQWLGRTVQNNGIKEGEMALDVLAKHPATARFISYKLAQYFVADEPPEALVKRLAQRFTQSDGDIRAVLASLFASAEFRDPAHYGKKFKTPYQYVISMARAGAIPVYNARPLLSALSQLGQPLFGSVTPDGYKNTQAAWLNPDALNRRINFAASYTSGRLPLDKAEDEDKIRSSKASLRQTERAEARQMMQAQNKIGLDGDALLTTLGSSISEKTRSIINNNPKNLRATMVLGSPDFMRR